MAITTLDGLVFDANVFAGLINQATTEKNNLVSAGVIVTNPLYAQRASGEGQMTTIPFFNPLANDDADVATANFDQKATVGSISMGEMAVIRHLRSKTFGAMDVASIVSGKDVVGAIADRFGDYWSTDLTKHAMAILTGIAKLGTNVTAGDSTTVLDVNALVDAAQTHGDAKEKFRTLVIHSAVHAGLQKAEGNAFVPASKTGIGFDTYAGYKLVINDRMPVASGVPKAVAAVNALAQPPDFVMFTGDLTHTTDDAGERRRRMREFRDIIAPLRAGAVHLMPGEHDASLDNGEAYREIFGPTHYTFDHKGLHAIVLDNVSDPAGQVGEAQLAWLAEDLSKQSRDARIVMFTHRPLFDLYPQWDWATRDGAKVIDILMPYRNVTVFYGHIHQEHHRMTGHIAHHAARSLMFPLPPPGSQPRRLPVPWDAGHPYQGLGWREVTATAATGNAAFRLAEQPVVKRA